MDNRMIRTRKRLFTQAELAASLGCSTGTVKRLERSFLTDRQRAYLNAVGYSVGYYPKRNKLSVCTTATKSPDTSGLQDEGTDG